MRRLIAVLALSLTCLAEPAAEMDVVVPPAAARTQWLRLQIKDNPRPGYAGTPVRSLGEFVAPAAIAKVVVDEYAGDPNDVRRYLAVMPAAAAQYFGPSLDLCEPRLHPEGSPGLGARLDWTSTSTVTFDNGKTGTLAVATVVVSRVVPGLGPGSAARPKTFGLSSAPDCVDFEKVPVDSLYVSYTDPDGHSWAFAVPVHRGR